MWQKDSTCELQVVGRDAAITVIPKFHTRFPLVNNAKRLAPTHRTIFQADSRTLHGQKLREVGERIREQNAVCGFASDT